MNLPLGYYIHFVAIRTSMFQIYDLVRSMKKMLEIMK